MNLTQLRSLARLKVPSAPSDVISDDNQLIIFNNGVLEITRETKCLPTYGSFDTAADTMEYNLSSLLSDYLCPLDEDLMKVYYYDGSEYTELDIVTLSYLDENYSDWQTADSGDPERCVILGDTLFLHPKPDSTISNGIKMFYCKKPTPMDGSTYIYPWGGTSEITRLTPYHTVVIDYYEKEAYEILDINDPNSPRRTRAYQKYIDKIKWMKAKIREETALMILKSKKTQFKIPSSYADNPF
ncbi:hypothetical protein DRJ16_05140 [Candidatus Woesearchaeota archaeon]|nr:MAG: hypothetical protein DRJ16_05140 [Candidatus Woesearchaeota archaeon]